MRYVYFVVDLQFGSTGKGLFCGYLAEKYAPDTIVTAWGPNAGHTYINAAGRKFVNIALPNGIVSQRLKRILIGPGSIINVDRFLWEQNEYADLLQNCNIWIHPHAAVVTDDDRLNEMAYGYRIGSTMKGVGEAMIRKIRRQPDDMNIAKHALRHTALGRYVTTVEEYNHQLDKAELVMVEGSQGFSLGINNGMYPYTTSRECTVQQLMVDCAIPTPWIDDALVYGVARTYPIRVANRHDDKGLQVGTSGPCYDDQHEIQWGEIGREPELTTVTRLPRRLFTFSEEQIRQAIRMNGVDNVFLNFANYVDPPHSIQYHLQAIRKAGAPVRWVGNGPTINDILEI